MILVDNSQIIIASIFNALRDNPIIDDNIVRHLVVNAYRTIRKKFGAEYGDMVICNDSPNCWRKAIFPYYKQNRKSKQRTADVDWDQIYKSMGTIREEIIEAFPYKHIKLEGAEADDIIAIMVRRFHNQEKIVIISNDKDFQQLQQFPNVKQYSNITKDFVVCENPTAFLYEHIIRGDSSDGVPNILSDDSCIIDPSKRQNRVTKKVIADVLASLDNIETSVYAKNWERNKTLIDFSSIPQNIEDQILDIYHEKMPHKETILNYMIKHKLVNMMDSIQEF